jgi:hypothetical protein
VTGPASALCPVTKLLPTWGARLLRGSRAAPSPSLPAAPPGGAAERVPDAAPTSESAPGLLALDILCVQEVADAEFFAGELFRRKFHVQPPDFPLHFVSFYRATPFDLRVIGYVHYSQFEDSYLCGGLVIDDRLYRRMPGAHREAIRSGGGIAEHLLKVTFARLGHAAAIWGYVGDTRAERVDLRAGFRRTEHPYVMVCWMRDLSETDKRARMARVVALGPF